MKTSISLLFAISVSTVMAGPQRNSADYTLSQESNIGAYGTRSTSADYTLDGVGDPAAGESSSSDYRLRDGFAGQLLDAVELRVKGPVSVPETSTIDLDADLIYDDATMKPDVTVSWSIESGSIDSIDSNGRLTPLTVFQNSNSFARADHLTLSDLHQVVVINTLDDNFGSYAGDSIDDQWQWQFFSLDNLEAAANQDPDGDGQDNLFEFTAGLIPTDARSRFDVEIEPISEAPLAASILYGPVHLGRSYQVWAVDSLISNTWFKIEAPATAQAGEKEKVTDPAAVSGKRFYRVEITTQEPM